jgi:ferritin-like protein
MKVKDLIAELLKRNSLDDEVVVAYYDRGYCIDGIQITEPAKEIMEQAWLEIASESQEIVEGHLEFTQTGYEISEMFAEKITELLQKAENND